jgi:hypothetical protein
MLFYLIWKMVWCVRIPGVYSESIYRSRTQWPKEKVQKDKQRLTKHTCFLAIPTKSSIVRQLVPSIDDFLGIIIKQD